MEHNPALQEAADGLRSIYHLLERLVTLKMSRPSATYQDVQRDLENMACMLRLLHLLGEEL